MSWHRARGKKSRVRHRDPAHRGALIHRAVYHDIPAPPHPARYPARSTCHCDAAPREKNFFYVADLSSAKCSINPFKKQSSCRGAEEEGRADNTQMKRSTSQDKHNLTTNLQRGEDAFLGHLLYIF